MVRHVDLDALRVQRAEVAREAPTVTLYGDTITLPVEMPFAVVEAFAVDNAQVHRRAVIALLGPGQYDRALERGATADDLMELLQQVAELYGARPEVSSASTSSSRGNGTRSKRTSSGSTGSTSDTPSSDGELSAADGSAA